MDKNEDGFCVGVYMLCNGGNDQITEFGSGLWDTHEDSVLAMIYELIWHLLENNESNNKEKLLEIEKILEKIILKGAVNE